MNDTAKRRIKAVTLRIELADVTPHVWRRIIVPPTWSLARLHAYLQWVMGWQDRHVHEFHLGERVMAPAWWIAEIAHDSDIEDYVDERRVSVGTAVRQVAGGADFTYHYDMGDDWRHRIVVDRFPPTLPGEDLLLPLCVAGESACPPEDIGGPVGYAHFVAVISDPHHAEHLELLRWIGGVFDPRGFDLNRLNRNWRARRRAAAPAR